MPSDKNERTDSEKLLALLCDLNKVVQEGIFYALKMVESERRSEADRRSYDKDPPF